MCIRDRAYAEEQGITVLPLESQEISPTADVTGQLQNLLANGANVIYVQSLSFGPAQVIGTLRALQAWDSVVVGGVNWSLNTDVVNILGENAALMDGYYGVMPSYWWNDTDNPGVQMALEDFTASGLPETKKDVGYLLSYGQMFGVANILRHAMNTVGFEGLTGQTVFEAMQDMGTIDVGGTVSYTHLDVYKRQRPFIASFSGSIAPVFWVPAVSTTTVRDVYKRQTEGRAQDRVIGGLQR